MLEIKNLTKIYKTKGGVEVKALDNISVNFPNKGMVFLLGKSCKFHYNIKKVLLR